MRGEEVQIVRRMNNGDEEAFRDLFNLYYKRLTIYASGYLVNYSVAEDLVQDLFVDLWAKRTSLTITTSVSSYLFSAIHNRCIQHLRKIKVRDNWQHKQILKLREAEIMLNHSSDFSHSEMELKEIQDAISIELSNLPARTREIFELSRNHLMSNQDIAVKLNVSIKTVEYHISKALNKLRSSLENFFT